MKLPDSTCGTNYIVPFSNGLLRPPHVERIGPALFLFMLFEDLVTTGDGTDGLVQGGKPVPDVYLAEILGLHRKTVAAYRRRLETYEYIRTIRTGSGYIVRVMKSKKWAWRQQLGPKNGQERGPKSRPEMTVSETEMAVSTTERSQKVPSRADKAGTKRDEAAEAVAPAAFAASLEPWTVIGLARSVGDAAFRQFWETSYSGRNGHPLSRVMGECADAWQASGRTVPGPFFARLAEIRKLERRAEQPIEPEIIRLEAPD